jgi:hypothetical protein
VPPVNAALRAWAAALAAALAVQGASAAEGGYSNYIPGTYGDFGMALAPTDTWTLRNDVYYYGADTSRSVRSGRIEADVEIEILMNMTTVLYKPELELFGATYAAGVFLPFVDLDIDSSLEVGARRASSSEGATGLGDAALIPLALYWNQGNFHASLLQLAVAPTGDYDVNEPVNEGLNYWSFDTNLALTHLDPDTGREFSLNIGHIYNTENDQTDYQTGQELHFDVVFNQYFSETLAVGVHGFFLDQITGDSGRGARLGGFKGEAAGIGPALLWTPKVFGHDVSVIAKWLHEFHAENRLEGDHVYMGFALSW